MGSFLGFTNYYREFVKDYAHIVAPLNRLKGGNIEYIWDEEVEHAFNAIVQALTTEPVLALPTDDGDFVLDTDASAVAISGILQQWQTIDNVKKLRVISYGSRGLRKSERNYGAPKAEMLAALTFCEQYRNFLIPKKFTLRCDNIALMWLKTYSVASSMVARWITRLDGYFFEFIHRDRRRHFNADGLSKQTQHYRRAEDVGELILPGFNFLAQEQFNALNVFPETSDDPEVLKPGKKNQKLVTTDVLLIEEDTDKRDQNFILHMTEDEKLLLGSVDRLSPCVGTPACIDDEDMPSLVAIQPYAAPLDDPKGESSLGTESDCETEDDLQVNAPDEDGCANMLVGNIVYTADDFLDFPNPYHETRCSSSCSDCPLTDAEEPNKSAPRRKEGKRARKRHETTGGAFILDNGAPENELRDVVDVCALMMQPKYTSMDLKKAQRSDVALATMINFLSLDEADRKGKKSTLLRCLTQGQKGWFSRNRADLELNSKKVLLNRYQLPGETKSKRVIVLPQLYQFEVMHEAHDLMGHQGENKTFAKIANCFDWPGMREDIAKYVASCPKCQQSKGPNPARGFPLKPIVVERPNQLVQIDFEKLCPAEDGSIGLLVAIDHFTKFAMAFPLKEFTAKAAVEALYKNWVLVYGSPETIQSDQGSQFESALFQEFALLIETRKIRSTPYHPQTNGEVERYNRTLVGMLRVACSRHQTDWPEHVQKMIYAYNCSRQESTKLTPNLLFLGRDSATPIWWMFPNFNTEARMTASEFSRKHLLDMGEYMQLARRNMDAAQVRQKRNHDKKLRKSPTYTLGEMVMVYLNVVRKGGVRKLERQWRGPFRIKTIFQDGRYFEFENGYKAHYNRLKKYEGRPHEFRVNDDGEFSEIWNDGRDWSVIAPTILNEPFVEEWNASHASDDESLREPEFRRSYNLRSRKNLKPTINENYISGEPSSDEEEQPQRHLAEGVEPTAENTAEDPAIRAEEPEIALEQPQEDSESELETFDDGSMDILDELIARSVIVERQSPVFPLPDTDEECTPFAAAENDIGQTGCHLSGTAANHGETHTLTDLIEANCSDDGLCELLPSLIDVSESDNSGESVWPDYEHGLDLDSDKDSRYETGGPVIESFRGECLVDLDIELADQDNFRQTSETSSADTVAYAVEEQCSLPEEAPEDDIHYELPGDGLHPAQNDFSQELFEYESSRSDIVLNDANVADTVSDELFNKSAIDFEEERFSEAEPDPLFDLGELPFENLPGEPVIEPALDFGFAIPEESANMTRFLVDPVTWEDDHEDYEEFIVDSTDVTNEHNYFDESGNEVDKAHSGDVLLRIPRATLQEEPDDPGTSVNSIHPAMPDWSNVITTVEGDLFQSTDSLANCVSMDLAMGAGIAKDFKYEFGHIQKLFDQRAITGEIAVLTPEEIDQKRHVYYLITKVRYFDKPSIEVLEKCLLQMRAHASDNKITAISMPRIGCGLDRLPWRRVYALIHDIFEGTGIHITVYVLPIVSTMTIVEKCEWPNRWDENGDTSINACYIQWSTWDLDLPAECSVPLDDNLWTWRTHETPMPPSHTICPRDM
jgi:transposase InsO family protein/O-acetyl-ADP-ribose deacetylase (regulator of RNase III)